MNYQLIVKLSAERMQAVPNPIGYNSAHRTARRHDIRGRLGLPEGDTSTLEDG